MAKSTELSGHMGEVERLLICVSPDTNQDEGDTSTRVSASAGDAVKPVLCPIGGCRFGDGSSVCSDDEDALSKSQPSVHEDNGCGDDYNLGGDDRPPGMVVDNKSKEDKSMQGDVMLVGDEMVHMLV